MTRKFEVKFELDGWEISDGVIELDQQVFDNVDDEWRKDIYNIGGDDEIAAFIGYHLCVRNSRLNEIEGFSNLENNLANVIKWPQGLDDYKTIAKEIK
jgi:hypothetical protein